jgi:hypothetical protein
MRFRMSPVYLCTFEGILPKSSEAAEVRAVEHRTEPGDVRRPQKDSNELSRANELLEANRASSFGGPGSSGQVGMCCEAGL